MQLRFIILIISFLQLSTLSAQTEAIHDYFKTYCSSLNNYTDTYNSAVDRKIFKIGIIKDFFPNKQSVVFNDARPNGSEYITIDEYLDNLIIDNPNGVQISYENLQIITESLKHIKVRITLIKNKNGTIQRIPLVFALKIAAFSENNISALIIGINKLGKKYSNEADENKKSIVKEDIKPQVNTVEKAKKKEDSQWNTAKQEKAQLTKFWKILTKPIRHINGVNLNYQGFSFGNYNQLDIGFRVLPKGQFYNLGYYLYGGSIGGYWSDLGNNGVLIKGSFETGIVFLTFGLDFKLGIGKGSFNALLPKFGANFYFGSFTVGYEFSSINPKYKGNTVVAFSFHLYDF